MGQTLTHGIYLPDKGERNCYSGLASNWQLLDGAVGTIAEHTSALAGKAPLVHTHSKSDITDFPAYGTTAGTICEGNDSRLSDARTPVAHTHGKADITNLFNSANTWTSLNAYNGIILLNSSSDVEEQFKQKLPKDVSVSTDALVRFNTLTDSENHNVVVEALGHWASYVSKSTSLKYKNDSTKQGTIDFRLESSGSGLFYPQSPFECSLGNSGNQWNNLYAKNYYYNGVAWGLDKANVWSAWQTQEHTTEPLIRLRRSNLQIGNPIPASQQIIGTILFADKNNLNLGLITCRDNTNGDTCLTLIARQRYDSNGRANNGTQYESRIDLGIDSSKNLYLRPNSNGQINLGTSTNKWKTLNGVNPGALNLPDYTQYEPINFSQWNTSGALTNTYTPTEDGWLFVNIKDTATNSIFIYAKSIQDAQSYSVSAYGNGSQGYSGRLSTIIPVIKGITYAVVIKAASVNDIYAVTFFPALGNV